MAAPFYTLEHEIEDAKRAVGLAKRDVTELERQAKTYYDGDELNYSNSFRYELLKGYEKLEKAERKLKRLLKRKTNPMKKKATAAQLRNLAKGRKKLAAMRRTKKKAPVRRTRPTRRRRRNPDISPEAWELILFAENSQPLMNQLDSIRLNIARKINSGIYDAAKAPLLWKYWFDSAAKLYIKEHGTGGGYGFFTPAIRREAAAYYAPLECTAIVNGDYEYVTGKVSSGSKKKKAKRKTKGKTSKQMFTPKRNPAYGNYSNARNVLKTGRTTNPVRQLKANLNLLYLVMRSSRYFTGYSFSTQKNLAVHYTSLGAAKAAAQKLADKTGSDIRIVDARK